MKTQLHTYFFEESSKAFQFLETDHSFSEPKINIDKRSRFSTVTFMGKEIALECILDIREGDVTCKIAKVIDGRKTKHYAVNEKRERVRDEIAAILRRKGIRGQLFTKLSRQMKIEEIIKTALSDYAQMLRKYDKVLLNVPNKIFDP